MGMVKLKNENYKTEEIGELISLDAPTATIRLLNGSKYRSEGTVVPVYYDETNETWKEYNF